MKTVRAHTREQERITNEVCVLEGNRAKNGDKNVKNKRKSFYRFEKKDFDRSRTRIPATETITTTTLSAAIIIISKKKMQKKLC